MKQPAWVAQAIVAGKKYHIKKQSHFLNNVINLSALFGIFFLFFVFLSLGHYITTFLYLPVAILGLGYSLHCLNVLIPHEACHHLFILTKNENRTKFWNRFFGWLGAIPVGLNYKEYWALGHIQHHRNPVVPQDPEVCHPMTGRELIKRAAEFLLIPGLVQWKAAISGKGVDFECPLGGRNSINKRGMFFLLIFWAGVFLLLFSMSFFSINALVALFFAFQISAVLRIILAALQHGGEAVHEKNPFFRSFTTIFSFHFILEPFNINYHFDHHLCDFIPWYLLPKYHRELEKIVPRELHHYFFVRQPLKQMSGKREGVPPQLRHLLEV